MNQIQVEFFRTARLIKEGVPPGHQTLVTRGPYDSVLQRGKDLFWGIEEMDGLVGNYELGLVAVRTDNGLWHLEGEPYPFDEMVVSPYLEDLEKLAKEGV